jgi:hypothetical protein
MEREKRIVKVNPIQLLFMMQKPKSATSVWPRGSGKSYIIAWLIHMIVKYMPRSTWAIGGRTFTHMLEITLLPTFYALANFGYIKDIHYVVKGKPSAKMDFARPLKPTVEYQHTITFFNGTTFQLLSQDRNSRGGDVQGGIWDESLLIDWHKYDEQFVPTLRGFMDEFGHIPFYRGIYHFSSMPDNRNGQRLLDKGNYYSDHGIDLEMIMKKLIRLQLAFIDNNDINIRRELWPQIQKIRKNIRFFKDKNNHLYTEGNAFDNIANLGLDYLIDLRRNMLDLTFRIEVMNERVANILNGFYCNLNEDIHLYDSWNYSHIDDLGLDKRKLHDKDCRFDNDLDKHKPIHLGIDPGTHINVAAVAQYHFSEIRFLKDFYVKAPGLLKHLIENFIQYYQYHPKKLVKISYDTSSSSQQQYETNKTLIDQVKEALQKAGWTVEILSKGKKLTHHERYELINDMFLQSNIDDQNKRQYPLLKYNRYNCHNLIVALGNTEVKQSGNDFKKDKSGERDANADQLKEPHLTDAHDYIIDDLLKDQYKKRNLTGLGEFRIR